MEELKNRILSDSELEKVNAGFSWEINKEQTELKVTLTETESAVQIVSALMFVVHVTPQSRDMALAAAADMDAKRIKKCTIHLASAEGYLFEITGIDY